MRPTNRFAMFALTLIIAGVLLLPARAEDPAGGPSAPGQGAGQGQVVPKQLQASVDMEKGEEDPIRRRHEWFYGDREVGANGRMRELRREAMAATQEMIRVQKEENRGREEAINVWSCRGPSSSNFGAWGFGRVSGRIVALGKDFTNNILYVGSASGGLWKSTNDGASWIPIFDGVGTMPIGALAVDPNAPLTIWAGTGENSMNCEDYFGIGLLRSTDGGLTWQARNGAGSTTLQNLSAFANIVVRPGNSNRVVVGGRYRDCVNGNYYAGGIYTTDDGGATWTNRLVGEVTRVTQDPNDATRLWAGVQGDGVYRSTDGGNTWTRFVTGNGRADVTVSPMDSNYVYALFGGSLVFYQSTNGTAATPTFTSMSTGSSVCDGQCGYNMIIRADYSNRLNVIRGTIRLWRTTDGGVNWADLVGSWGAGQKVHQDMHTLLLDPSNANVWYVGCDGGIWKTTDGGANFTNLNSNLNLTQFYAVGNHSSDNDTIVGGCQDNSSLARNGATGDVWQVQQVTGDGFRCYIKASDPNYVYLTSYPCYETDCGAGTGPLIPEIYRSTTGVFGAFSRISATGNGLAGNEPANWVTPYILSGPNPGTMFLGTSRVYRSTDDGSSWTAISGDLTGGSGEIYYIEVNRANGDRLWAGTTSGRLWHCSNGNAGSPSWTDVSGGLPGRRVNAIAGDPADATRAFCTVGGFGAAHLYEYPGSGNWVARGGGLPNVPANAVFMMNANEIYVGTDVGLFKSTNRGVTFVPFMMGLPQGLVVTDLKYTAATNTLTVGTYGRGAWQITLACNVTCTASGPAFALVNTPAAFASTVTPIGCTGTPVYQWSFGDGDTSASANPNHTYTAPGTYTWVMTVTVDGIPCSQTGTINVCALTCTAAVPTCATAGSAVAFSASATSTCAGPITYTWMFGDGTIGGGASTTHTFAAVGDYTWTLIVTNHGLDCAQTGLIRVCQLTCSATVPQYAAVNTPVPFAGTGTIVGSCPGPVVYAWNFGDGATSASQNPSHTYAAVGDYTWTLTVTAGCLTCTRTGVVQVCLLTCSATVPPKTYVGFPTNFSSTATLTGSCPGPITYLWDFGDGSTLAGQNVTHTYAIPSAGTRTWTLTVSANGLTCTQTGTILVCLYDITMRDDRITSELCFNSVLGIWKYTVLGGVGVGSYTGNGVLKLSNGVLYLTSIPGAPWTLTAKHYTRTNLGTASFTYRVRRINSQLYDRDITNNFPLCCL